MAGTLIPDNYQVTVDLSFQSIMLVAVSAIAVITFLKIMK